MFKLRGSIIGAVVLGLLALPTVAFAAPPSHDDFDHAIVLDNRFGHSLDTTDATTAADDPDCGNGVSKTVWYTYTAPDAYDATLTASVWTERDMVMGVYKGERGSLEQLSCSPARSYETAFSHVIPAGETVHIMLADAGTLGIGGYVQVSFRATPPDVDVELTLTKTGLIETSSGVAVVRGTVECSRDAILRIYGAVRQKQDRKSVTGYFNERKRCDEGELELWTARATPSRGTFIKGAAAGEADWRDIEDPESNGMVDPTIYLKPCTIIGTPRSQRMEGTHRAETICALSGNDKVLGKDGNDKLVGGPGRDLLMGGEGNDVLTGGPGVGRNVLDGGPGHDVCKRETKQDVVRNCEEVS